GQHSQTYIYTTRERRLKQIVRTKPRATPTFIKGCIACSLTLSISKDRSIRLLPTDADNHFFFLPCRSLDQFLNNHTRDRLAFSEMYCPKSILRGSLQHDFRENLRVRYLLYL